MKRARVKLRHIGNACEMVELPGVTRYNNPIGRVCKVPGGYEYYSPPTPTTNRGPVRTKARAILNVLRDYKSWIGIR